jgi:hypothetical protein
VQTHTHFRAVFDVSPTGHLENAWAALVGEIRAWITDKERVALKGFFGGARWAGPSPSRAQVETRLLADGGGSVPEMWAVRYQHADANIKWRRWITDIGVASVGPREWRMAVELSHGIRPEYIGPEIRAPQPSSPRLITSLLSSERWSARVGSVRIVASPVPLKVGGAPRFANLLKDPRRLVPLVLVSCDRKTAAPSLDAVALSRALAGTGVVYKCESPECDDELEHFLPLRFRSPNGTVRIYAPDLDFSEEWTSARHRFFSSREIEDQGRDEIIGRIVRALTRSDAWRGLRSSVASIDDIDTRIRERRLTELRSKSAQSANEQKEFLALYEEENARLAAENENLKDSLKAKEASLKEAEDSIARLQYELELARELLEGTRNDAIGTQEALQAVLDMPEWPDNASAVAEFAIKISAGRLVLTEDGRRSLAESGFANGNGDLSVLWRCLRGMATHLHDLVATELPPQQIADTFRSRTGFELTWTESKQTKRDKRLMGMRRMLYGGREIDITPHIKYGSSPPRLLRVHFWVDRQRKQVVIGHCGDHLDTYGTRRRGQ